MQGRAGQMRDRRLKRVEAVIERQQHVLAEGDDDRLLLNAQYCRMSILRTGRQVLDRGALLPLRNGLLVDAVPLRQRPQALLTMLYRSTDCRCRAGAPL